MSFLEDNKDRRPVPEAVDFSSLQLSPQDMFLISQADGNTTVGEILHVLPFPPDEVAGMLKALRELGVLRWNDEEPGLRTPPAPDPEPEDEPAGDDGAPDELEDVDELEVLEELEELDDLEEPDATGDSTGAGDEGGGDGFGFDGYGTAPDLGAEGSVGKGEAAADDDDPEPESWDDVEPLDEDAGLVDDDLLDDWDDELDAEGPAPESEPTEGAGDDQEVEELEELEAVDQLDPEPESESEPADVADDAAALDELVEELDQGSYRGRPRSSHAVDRPGAVAPGEAKPAARAQAGKASDRRDDTASGNTADQEEELKRLQRRVRIQKRMLERDDPFEVLGVKKGADDKDIRDAYHRLSRLYHPDRYYNYDLDGELQRDLEEVYNGLQQAYSYIGTKEARKELLRKEKAARAAESEESGQPKAKTANADRLLDLAKTALAKGQYGSAITNYKLADQLDPGGGHGQKAKLVTLLEKVRERIAEILESDELPSPMDVEQIAETLAKIESVVPDVAALLREFCVFLYLHSDDFGLLRTYFQRLLNLNRMPDTLILGARIFIKGALYQTALDLLDEAKRSGADDPDIKRLVKEAKRGKA